VGMVLLVVTLLALVACIMSAIYKNKERPRMKSPAKKTVFQK